MSIADVSLCIYNTIQGHSSQLEEVDFLPILQRNTMLRVRHSNEGNPFLLPVLLERCRRIGSNRKNFYTASGELIIVISQACQLRAAVGSHKSAQES